MGTNQSLNGKTAIITGASSGIGKATAKALAERGANVTIVSRSEDRLEQLAEEIRKTHGSKVLVVATDVREPDQVERMVEETVDEFENLDILVNNAGLIYRKRVDDLPIDEYKNLMETNVDGMFYTTKYALPYLRETKGHLIFVGSCAAKYPMKEIPVYVATKWWTSGFAHSVEAAVGEDNVAVTLVNPSKVRTELKGEKEETLRKEYDEGEIVEPEEVAEVITFAASQENSTISEVDIYKRNKLSDHLS